MIGFIKIYQFITTIFIIKNSLKKFQILKKSFSKNIDNLFESDYRKKSIILSDKQESRFD